jgi:hypothetical protein
MTPQRLESAGSSGGVDEVSYVPCGALSYERLLIVSITRDRRLAHFAILVFF